MKAVLGCEDSYFQSEVMINLFLGAVVFSCIKTEQQSEEKDMQKIIDKFLQYFQFYEIFGSF